MVERMRCCLHTLTPIHIGCDEVYEPTSFVIDSEKLKLRFFDSLELLRMLKDEERKQFAVICGKGTLESIIELYRFIRQKCPPNIRATEVSICGDLAHHYVTNLQFQHQQNFNMRREFSTFIIPRTAFNPNSNVPYVPGSSVKGALRTAYLNYQQKRNPVGQQNQGKNLEQALLNYSSIETDPFRSVKISDFMPVGEIRTRVIYGVNRKKKPTKFGAKGPPQILEVLERGCLFEGWISVGSETAAGIANPITMKALQDSLNSFYTKELYRENRDLQGLGVAALTPPGVADTYLMRIGRHSGAECVTVEGHRSIKIIKGKGIRPATEPSATTLWLAADSRKPATGQPMLPFGWATLEPMTDKLYQKLTQPVEAISQSKNKIVTGAIQPEAKGREQPGRIVSEARKPSQRDKWSGVQLSWDPGTRTVMASTAAGKAFTKEKTLIPQSIRDRLCSKRKLVRADIEVEPAGGKNFKIVRIDPVGR